MPTYEYQCSHCDDRFEEFQSITAEPICKCPKCGSSKVRRLIGCGSGVIFKGSGFYQTDYKNNKSGCEPGKSDSCKSCPNAKK